MATLVLGALGTALGGPIGGAIGALLGRQVDAQIIGSPRREGPRLKELAISTSSYGTPMPRHFGRMRAEGTIVWSTDLVESRETSGGGKGKPKTTSYSYSISFAVVLSSRPIHSVGRIWADGNLLRGAGGDLKTGGLLRIHNGHGDQLPDPLLAAALGPACPALRGRAYAVFEDLLLEDFGNRIPALSFEIIADEGGAVSLAPIVAPLGPGIEAQFELTALGGFSDEGGPLADTLAQLSALYPSVCTLHSGGLVVEEHTAGGAEPGMLPEPLASKSEEAGSTEPGAVRSRDLTPQGQALALRYYDVLRDFQPGLQRSEGPWDAADETSIEFSGAFLPDDARALVRKADLRRRRRGERLNWRTAAIDPAAMSGRIVRAPGMGGLWTVEQWEWNDGGVELELVRFASSDAGTAPGDAGAAANAGDWLPGPTVLRAFELPNFSSETDAAMFAAVSGANDGWRGAMLFRSDGSELVALGPSGRNSAVMGQLAGPLAPSPALLIERYASLEVEVVSPAMQFAPASEAQLAEGRNRLLVGDEVLQFASAEQLGEIHWRLSGLLRGRGASEHVAQAEHAAGTAVTLLDEGLVGLELAPGSTLQIAAIGAGDGEPVLAGIENSGAAARPLSPVHPRVRLLPDGALECRWTRRARGGWRWLDSVETPLGEERERYLVGIGAASAPVAGREVDSPSFTLPTDVAVAHAGAPLWVCQIGQSARSLPLLLAVLD